MASWPRTCENEGAMKPSKLLLVLAVLLAPGLAAAQGYYGGSGPGYYGQPPATQLPGGFHDRTGRLAWGFSLGLGGMHDRGSNVTSCNNCSYNPLAFEADAHIGGFIAPRLALMAEAQINAQTVSSSFYGDTVLSQTALMIAAQFWVTPQLWVKGGIGFAHLYADNAYEIWDFGTGGAVMGAAGYEIMSARNFSVDLQGRLIQGTYKGFNDSITSGTVGVGINWY
jgi:hypothetical protein